MSKFKICCEWTVAGEFEVEAASMDEAIKLVTDNEDNKFPLPTGEYVDDTFVVDTEMSEEV